jgi:hypothetical protein
MKWAMLYILSVYKRFISPLLPPACRFHPTCSVYAYEAVEKFGIFKGLRLAVIRLAKCHPFHTGGFDPVPDGLNRPASFISKDKH